MDAVNVRRRAVQSPAACGRTPVQVRFWGRHIHCVVEKAEAVTHDKFERLKRHPMHDNDLIAENTDLMFCDVNNQYHCLLIYDEDQGDGLLIESEGAPYARYAQYIPNAKLLNENHMQRHLQKMKFYCPLEISRWDDDEYNARPCEKFSVNSPTVIKNDVVERLEKQPLFFHSIQ